MDDIRGLVLTLSVFASACSTVGGDEMKVPVKFSGGYETDPRDHGRPVVLVAAALGVKPEVFREAFSGVTPAMGRPPTGEEARRNKEALLKVLAPHGVTNERLDEVSDYYRYQPQRGELWKMKPAAAHAIVKDGKIERIVITSPGAGYSSTPKATVPGYEGQILEVTLHFDKDLAKNGSLDAVKLGEVIK